ncbi:hypothetical protein LOD99_10667 [Oopsacas minuta]|uniref:Uncharacterized protein n=1 Tax=Oopsacas minuta TaxID=111878 RepID=A0AAV7KF18_9METZ|nr:hypothetical protein LOD99_10667 [Oopsacas minuta]
MGVGGSKHGISYKLQKRRVKQCSKKKPVLSKDMDGGASAKDNQLPVPNSSLDKLDRDTHQTAILTESINTYKDSDGVESHQIKVQHTRSNGSTEYLGKRQEQDNISRELALTSLPHYISHEFYTGD